MHHAVGLSVEIILDSETMVILLWIMLGPGHDWVRSAVESHLPAKPISQLRFDYDTTATRLRRKIDMLIFRWRRIASNGSRRARYVVVGS